MRKFVLLAALATGLLRADTITYTLAPIPGGFSYRFTLANMGDTGGTLFDLFLSLPTDISNIDTSTIGTRQAGVTRLEAYCSSDRIPALPRHSSNGLRTSATRLIWESAAHCRDSLLLLRIR